MSLTALQIIERQTCACGCGETPLAKSLYCRGHWNRDPARRQSISRNRHKGSRVDHGDGYISVSRDGVQVLEHIAIAERALGKPLPPGVEVHHVDHNRGNNSNRNLVICPSRGYHQLLHQRERALDACGHADWRKCSFCKQYDSPENLYIPKRRGTITHATCFAQWKEERKELTK